MDSYYYAISLITAGICLSMGGISFAICWKQYADRTNFYFGVVCLSMVAFILIPPVGFITVDVPAYLNLLVFKRIFIFAYYAIFPWFLYYYSERPGKRFPQIITVFVSLSYFVMFYSNSSLPRPLWTYFAMVLYGLNFFYGIQVAIWMYRRGDRSEARWLTVAVSIYGILWGMAVTNHIFLSMYGENLFGMKRFFPMHLHALVFVLIMGLRLKSNATRKLQLERVVVAQNQRWQSLIHASPLFVMELSPQGKLISVNEFAAAQLGSSVQALLGRDWFQFFASVEEGRDFQNHFESSVYRQISLPFFKTMFRTITGRAITINWVNFNTYDEGGSVESVTMIGQDVTEQEHALVELRQLKEEIQREKLPNDAGAPVVSSKIIGSSKAMMYALQKARQVAATHATVLLQGETGVGKELFADFIHANSSRNDQPFIKVNCGSLPPELIEDELFGHEKGAFTSAFQSRSGRFELAHGGTLFLDEIGELPLQLQPKLLRVLQEGTFERIGGQKTLRVDVRVIAATNRNLEQEVREGKFRGDLFYRLNVFPITIPALRDRKEDLDSLIHSFVSRAAKEYAKEIHTVSKADLRRLHDYSWPGNVRELKNVIERGVIQSHNSILRVELQGPLSPVKIESADSSLVQMERDHIVRILNECNWRINGAQGAAERLAMHPNTLRSRMKKLDIHRSSNASTVN